MGAAKELKKKNGNALGSAKSTYLYLFMASPCRWKRKLPFKGMQHALATQYASHVLIGRKRRQRN